MTSKELLFSHRYIEAAEAYSAHLSAHPEQNYYPGLGDALACLGDFAGAKSAYQKANEIESRRLRGSFPFMNQIGMALWLDGNREAAIQEWHQAAAKILDGSCNYGDLAGGATQGLLLWYGAVTIGLPVEYEFALNYFRGLKRRKISNIVMWPRSIYIMALGERTFEEVLVDATGSDNSTECIKLARTDLMKRRKLCQALFYGATKDRRDGDEAGCMKKMQACFELENPIIEVEWYLARGECSG